MLSSLFSRTTIFLIANLLASTAGVDAYKIDFNSSLTTSSNAAPVSTQPTASTGTLSLAASSSSQLDSASTGTAPTYYTAIRKTGFPYSNAITVLPNATTSTAVMSSAIKCWSEFGAWKDSSASFWNAQVANRTWSITSFYSSTVVEWTETKTLYPSSVSTYKLCDGTPRANVRPITTVVNSTSTIFATWTETATPSFAPTKPCNLSQNDYYNRNGCRLLRTGTDALVNAEDQLLNMCGNPAHVTDTQQDCLLGGGPIELIYFPVQKDNGSLCNNVSASITSVPLQPGATPITTLGHTFETGSVYLSFKTLFATYDGYFDHVGPNFTDLIVPLHSSDVSTQCGGWAQAYGPGTALNYADLNWPAPASAYSCQHRCSVTNTATPYLAAGGGPNIVLFNLTSVQPGPECNTIWSDVNPVLAVPTKIREMVPEWSTCSYWNEVVANFWFDPPLALQEATAVATPTSLSFIESPFAQPSSTAKSPAAPSTQAAEAAVTTLAVQTVTSKKTAPVVSQSTAIETLSSSAIDEQPPEGTPSTQSHTVEAPALSVLLGALSSMASSPSERPANPAATAPGTPSFTLDPIQSAKQRSSAEDAASPNAADPTKSSSGFDPIQEPTASSNAANTDPVKSSFAFAPIQSPSVPSLVGPTDASNAPSAARPAFTFDPLPSGSSPLPPVSESPTLLYVVGAGSLTLTVSTVPNAPQAALVGTQTLLAGGPAVTISGQAFTNGKDGIELLTGPSTASVQAGAATSTSTPDDNPLTYAQESLTIGGAVVAVSINGTTLSQGGGALEVGGATVTMGASGLQVIKSGSTVAMSEASQTSLPELVGAGSTTSARPSTGAITTSRAAISSNLRMDPSSPAATTTSKSAGAKSRTLDHVAWRLISAILAISIALWSP